ncbi:conserved exported hypothetical protein [Enterobacterales bacterium 8AC]|nr:conserved exported hypothetical protein [Enterobacterales bacterium 8AC]
MRLAKGKGCLKLPTNGLLLTLVLSMQATAGGVSLGQTRMVFLAQNLAQSLTIKNTSAQNYLIQTRVQRDNDGATPAPFLVTPPLFVLKGNTQQTVRVLFNGEPLPLDRESLFMLMVTAIPAQTQQAPQTAAESSLSMGFRFTTKLFYRPEGLKPPVDEAPCRLVFSPQAHGVKLSNPTPYYLTLGRLILDDNNIPLATEGAMLAPYEHRNYATSTPVVQAQWQTITDYGGLSPQCQAEIPRKEP